MTRILLILDPEHHLTHISEDPRPPREVMVAVNTRQLAVGASELQLHGARQWAVAHTPVNSVVVLLQPPPVELTPRQYQVLFGLAQAQPAAQIAAGLGISRRMVYIYIAELKARFDAPTVQAVLHKAAQYGLLEI
jgi:DNA-binding CsgD family transcriptional regulator